MKISVLVALILSSLLHIVASYPRDPSEFFGLSEVELVRLKNLIPEEHKVVTSDGYILNLVRVRNPLINNGSSGHKDKRPILFVPGEACLSTNYISQDLYGEPKDLSKNIDLVSSDIETLVEKLKSEPAARSLAILASYFGYEIWLLNRRGTKGSFGHTSSQMKPYKGEYKLPNSLKSNIACCASGVKMDTESCSDPVEDLKQIIDSYGDEINPKYWNYSLDEQALIDLPNTIDYILKYTKNDKIDIVSHSSGSALAMMMLAAMPERARAVSTMILLGPSLYQANATNPVKLKYAAIKNALINYTGAFSIAASSSQAQCLITEACSQQFVRARCLSDLVPKIDEVGNDIRLFSLYVDATGQPISSRQITHLVQVREKGRMYAYDYGEKENLARYGKKDPPLYDVTKLRQNGVAMRIFRGCHDAVVTKEDMDQLIEDMGYIAFSLPNHALHQRHIHFLQSSVFDLPQKCRIFSQYPGS